MADTIGDLVDKLTIANCRLWHVEDARREFSSKEDEKSLEQAEHLLNQVSKINKERNSLIDQINAGMGVLVDKAANKDSTLQLTSDELLGTGKNKFYKTETD
jgi:hypothetical protein